MPTPPRDPARLDADLGPELTAALDALEQLDDAPLSQHVAAFDTAHRLLQERLAEADR